MHLQGRRHRDVGSIPGSRGSPGEGNGNPLQYSCLGNPMDREPVHGVAKELGISELLNNTVTRGILWKHMAESVTTLRTSPQCFPISLKVKLQVFTMKYKSHDLPDLICVPLSSFFTLFSPHLLNHSILLTGW